MFIESNPSSGGGGASSYKDFIYDKVFNGGFTPAYDFVVYNNRVTLNKGKVVVDAENNTVYLYADFTMLADFGGNYYLLNTSPIFDAASYKQRGTSTAGMAISQSLFIDRLESVSGSQALTYNSLKMAYYSTSVIGIATNSLSVKNGERYIVYAAWQY